MIFPNVTELGGHCPGSLAHWLAVAAPFEGHRLKTSEQPIEYRPLPHAHSRAHCAAAVPNVNPMYTDHVYLSDADQIEAGEPDLAQLHSLCWLAKRQTNYDIA